VLGCPVVVCIRVFALRSEQRGAVWFLRVLCGHPCANRFPRLQPHAQYILFESASGFGLFEVTEAEEIGALLPTVRGALGGWIACR